MPPLLSLKLNFDGCPGSKSTWAGKGGVLRNHKGGQILTCPD